MDKHLLLLSGIDPTSGAGLIADAFTARELSCHPSVIPSVLTVQNTHTYHYDTAVSISYIIDTFNTLRSEFSFAGAKIGLVPKNDPEWLLKVKKTIFPYLPYIVIDPVIKATSDTSASFLPADYLHFISGYSSIILTPNFQEVETILTAFGEPVLDSIEKSVRILAEKAGVTVIATEGKKGKIVLSSSSNSQVFSFTPLILTREVHGTGCRFSTALASFLAHGESLCLAIEHSLHYMTRKLSQLTHYDSSSQDFLL